jgi:hypothetical protein
MFLFNYVPFCFNIELLVARCYPVIIMAMRLELLTYNGYSYVELLCLPSQFLIWRQLSDFECSYKYVLANALDTLLRLKHGGGRA